MHNPLAVKVNAFVIYTTSDSFVSLETSRLNVLDSGERQGKIGGVCFLQRGSVKHLFRNYDDVEMVCYTVLCT